MEDLSKKQCIPCKEGAAPLKGKDLHLYFQQLQYWALKNEHHIEKEYTFKNFQQALDFVILVGDLAEKEKHHPDILLSYGKVKIMLWTHKINGLTESDFIMAAKIDECYLSKI